MCVCVYMCVHCKHTLLCTHLNRFHFHLSNLFSLLTLHLSASCPSFPRSLFLPLSLCPTTPARLSRIGRLPLSLWRFGTLNFICCSNRTRHFAVLFACHLPGTPAPLPAPSCSFHCCNPLLDCLPRAVASSAIGLLAASSATRHSATLSLGALQTSPAAANWKFGASKQRSCTGGGVRGE